MRKSTSGLSFGFVMASVLGFACYAIFNSGLYFIPELQAKFSALHSGEHHLVRIHDVLFSVHGFILSVVYLVQFLIYQSNSERPSPITMGVTLVSFLLLTAGAILALINVIDGLQYMYYLSLAKPLLAVVKCTPQLILNWQRRSTVGWSIGNVYFDFMGGVLSISQLMLDASIAQEFKALTGSIGKLLLGLVSIIIDPLFFLQHYYWFPTRKDMHVWGGHHHNPGWSLFHPQGGQQTRQIVIHDIDMSKHNSTIHLN